MGAYSTKKGKVMINIKEMENACNKHVNIFFIDGEIWKNAKCTNFYIKDDDDEENMLEFDNILIYQSEIEKIEILN